MGAGIFLTFEREKIAPKSTNLSLACFWKYTDGRSETAVTLQGRLLKILFVSGFVPAKTKKKVD